MQTDILTVTLNPTVDIATSVAEVVPGPKLRCAVPDIDPGGGGINVSRAISILRGTSRPFVAAGGFTGRMLEGLLRAEGIAYHAFAAPGDTRQSFSVTDSVTSKQYRFVLPGPQWAPNDVDRCIAEITDVATPSAFVVLSGSQPPGVPDSFPAALAEALRATDARLVVDTSGPALTALAAAPTDPPMVLRMDQAEADELAGHVLADVAATADYAQALVTKGCAEVVIIARGAEGSVLATREARFFCNAADVPVVSKIGAGDSFVGAFTLALAQEARLDTALKMGCAAASAAVMTEATRLCRREDFVAVQAQIEVRPV